MDGGILILYKIIMTIEEANEYIKFQYDDACEQIKHSQERIEELQTICRHTETFEGNYSYRIGTIQLAEICKWCGNLIKFIE